MASDVFCRRGILVLFFNAIDYIFIIFEKLWFVSFKRSLALTYTTMSKGKSNFWSSFWREKGKNTGKFTSNKLFGPTGWATPRRHIIDGSTNITSNLKQNTSSTAAETTESSPKVVPHDWTDVRVERIIDMANEITFDSGNIDEICAKLDDLLTGARTANKFIHSHQMCNKVFVTKINSGIMRLRRKKEQELADFYAQELKSVTRTANWSKAAPWIFIVVGILFLLLVNYLMGNFN
jgi:hypothetical protein